MLLQCDFIVLYSVLVGTRHQFTSLREFETREKSCKYIFMDDQNYQKYSISSNDSTFHNTKTDWTYVNIAPMLQKSESNRRNSRLLKLNPYEYIQADIIVYIDQKLKLEKERIDHLLDLYTQRDCSWLTLRHARYINRTLDIEYNAVYGYTQEKKPDGSSTMINKLHDQINHYHTWPDYHIYSNILIEGAFIIRDQRFLAKELSRLWLKEYFDWADRDQIAFPGALRAFKYNLSDAMVSNETMITHLNKINKLCLVDSCSKSSHRFSRHWRNLKSCVSQPINSKLKKKNKEKKEKTKLPKTNSWAEIFL